MYGIALKTPAEKDRFEREMPQRLMRRQLRPSQRVVVRMRIEGPARSSRFGIEYFGELKRSLEPYSFVLHTARRAPDSSTLHEVLEDLFVPLIMEPSGLLLGTPVGSGPSEPIGYVLDAAYVSRPNQPVCLRRPDHYPLRLVAA